MLIGLTVFVVYMYFFVGIGDVFVVIKSFDVANYLLYYALGIGAMILNVFIWVLSWRSLLGSLKVKVSLKKAFLFYWTGYFVDLIVPCQGVCGEVTRIYMVHEETKHDYGAIAAAGLTNRLIAYGVVTAVLTAGSIYLLVDNRIPSYATTLLVLSWAGAIVFFLFLLYLALSDRAAERITLAIIRVLGALRVKRYSEGEASLRLLESLERFHASFRFFRANLRNLAKPMVLQAVSFIIGISMYNLVFQALGFPGLPIDFLLVVFFLAGAIQDAASALSVGGLEILLTNIFIYFGIPSATSALAAAVLRSVTFWLPLLVGFLVVQVLGARRLINTKELIRIEAEEEKEIRKKKHFNPDFTKTDKNFEASMQVSNLEENKCQPK